MVVVWCSFSFATSVQLFYLFIYFIFNFILSLFGCCSHANSFYLWLHDYIAVHVITYIVLLFLPIS